LSANITYFPVHVS